MIMHVLYNHRTHQSDHVLTSSHGSFTENLVSLHVLFLGVVASLAPSWTPVLIIYSPNKLNKCQAPQLSTVSGAVLGVALHLWFSGLTVLRPLEEPFLFSGKSGDIFIKFHSLTCPVSSHLFSKQPFRISEPHKLSFFSFSDNHKMGISPFSRCLLELAKSSRPGKD